MLPGAEMLFSDKARYKPDTSLAVVNHGDAFIDTGFQLGDYMSIEMCYRVPTGATQSGYVLAGYYGGDDARDFRLFYAGIWPERLVVDVGQNNGASVRILFPSNSSNFGEWHTVLAPFGRTALIDGSIEANVQDGSGVDGSGAYGTAGLSLKLFADDPSLPNQPAAIRYVIVRDVRNGNVIHALWPDKRGGVCDAVDGRLILPQSGSVEIVNWESIS